MIYFANPCGDQVIEAMCLGKLGFIDTPAQGNIRPPIATWCADNGCFGKGYPGDVGWMTWLWKMRHQTYLCKFATAPDVVGNAVETLKRSRPFLPSIREFGYPAALVAQDGLECLRVPWDEFDTLFIGGTTEWKLGPAVVDLVKEARSLGKWVHMGRVNSRRRLFYADSIGCDSVDGTYLVFGPRTNFPKLMGWLSDLKQSKESQ